MNTIDLIKSSLNLSYSITLPLLEDLKTAPLLSPSANGIHAHWILGHLLHSEGSFKKMMTGEANPLSDLAPIFGGKSQPDAAGKNYPSYNEMLAKLVAMREDTLKWIDTMSEADMDNTSRDVPPGFESLFGTWRNCLNMISLHWMNHRGQLANCRRAAGRPVMIA